MAGSAATAAALADLVDFAGLEVLARVSRERGAARFLGVPAESAADLLGEFSSDEGGGTSIKLGAG